MCQYHAAGGHRPCGLMAMHALADPEAAVAEVKAEGLIISTRKSYQQEYVLFLRSVNEKITFCENILITRVRPRQ
jgi:ketosteroid isomerase-like protein